MSLQTSGVLKTKNRASLENKSIIVFTVNASKLIYLLLLSFNLNCRFYLHISVAWAH